MPPASAIKIVADAANSGAVRPLKKLLLILITPNLLPRREHGCGIRATSQAATPDATALDSNYFTELLRST